MIVVTEMRKNDSRFIDKSEWQTFLDHYKAAGYISIEVADASAELLIHEQLLMSK